MSRESREMRRGSPLVEFLAEHPTVEADESRGVEMGERAFWGHVNLRGDMSDVGFLSAVGGALWLARAQGGQHGVPGREIRS